MTDINPINRSDKLKENYYLYTADLLRMSKVDFSPGSSKDGKAFRHPVDSNWVVAK